MQTSRIRLALSSVQLFIERCLRNLEPAVDPAAIHGTQWDWRKRYRVWQANREVFLWPENWLDPSLRDDQSPFFKTTMSQLLQSDITDDTAAKAYLDYLSCLEGVAKLDPCGLYYDSASDRGTRHRPHRRRQPHILLPPPRARRLDPVGGNQALDRGQPGGPLRLERPPLALLAAAAAPAQRLT